MTLPLRNDIVNVDDLFLTILMISLTKKGGSSYTALQALATYYRESSWSWRGGRRQRLYTSNGRSTGLSRGDSGMNVFDRKAKRWHKNRAAMAPDADIYDYLRDEVSVDSQLQMCVTILTIFVPCNN